MQWVHVTHLDTNNAAGFSKIRLDHLLRRTYHIIWYLSLLVQLFLEAGGFFSFIRLTCLEICRVKLWPTNPLLLYSPFNHFLFFFSFFSPSSFSPSPSPLPYFPTSPFSSSPFSSSPFSSSSFSSSLSTWFSSSSSSLSPSSPTSSSPPSSPSSSFHAPPFSSSSSFSSFASSSLFILLLLYRFLAHFSSAHVTFILTRQNRGEVNQEARDRIPNSQKKIKER